MRLNIGEDVRFQASGKKESTVEGKIVCSIGILKKSHHHLVGSSKYREILITKSAFSIPADSPRVHFSTISWKVNPPTTVTFGGFWDIEPPPYVKSGSVICAAM